MISSGAIALDGYEVDADVVSKVAKFAGVELQPMGAFVGGVLAQEVFFLFLKFLEDRKSFFLKKKLSFLIF